MDWLKEKISNAVNFVNSKQGSIKNPMSKLTVSDIPFEAHLPGYQFCGPGTKFDERTSKGQTGINSLDNACMKHDAVYNSSQIKNDENRRKRAAADDELIQAASSFRKNSSSLKDKAAGLATEGAMRAKKFLRIF